MTEGGTFARNLAVLADRFPDLHARLVRQTTPLSKPVVEDGRVVDIDLGAGRLYKQDGRRAAEEQAATFVVAPARTGYVGVDGITGDSIVSRRFYAAMVESLQSHGVEAIASHPHGRVGFLFVFGIGLGYHLPLLAREIDVDHVVVAEALEEFLLHSLHAVDWVELLEILDARGTTLHLVVEANPFDIVGKIGLIVDKVGEMFLDGAYFYRHYPFWALDVAFQRVLEDAPMKMVGRGYYEDERKMVRNAVTNLHKFDHYLVTGAFRTRHDVPAFLVASGPSLDNDLEYVKRWRDHAVIFSGGSSLEALLDVGIIPDYHVELENVVAVYDMCEHILDRYPHLFPERRFTGMRFIASYTVNPRVPPLFDETYFFFRDSVTSTTCFGTGPVMNGIGPSISNTVMAVASRLGFDEMYLFGHDCGWRDEGEHHSRRTMYYTSKTFKTDRMEGEYSYPGNFGGTIRANMIFAWTRDMLEQKVEKFRLKVFNCSDGAFIKGATPKLGETLHFPGKPVDKEKTFQRVRSESMFQAAGAFLARIDMAAFLDENDRLRDGLLRMVDDVLARDEDFPSFVRRLTAFDADARRGDVRRVYPFYQGATIGFTKAACYFINRIRDDAKRQAVFRDFAGLFRDLHVEMFEEGRTIFSEAKAMVEGGAEPWWTDGLPTTPGTTY